MKTKKITLFVSLFIVTTIIYAQPNWPAVKSSQAPLLLNTTEYNTPMPLGIGNLGWEDGQYITRDGLTVYCFYSPVDLLSMSFLNPTGQDPCNVTPYKRGPALGVSFDTIPPLFQTLGCTEFLNSNILMSHRNTINDTFPAWTPTSINFPATFDGAPSLVLNSTNPSIVDFFVFAQLNPDSSQTNDNTGTIFFYQNTGLNPTGSFSPFPGQINTDSTTEDNPHLERITATNFVLFFTSDDHPNGTGDVDIFVSESIDGGANWSPSVPVNFNTPQFEDMPHIWQDSLGNWWMYYMGMDALSNSYIIKRQQQNPGDWINWMPPDTIMTNGNGHAVGEPTLTQWGDIVFGFVYDAGNGNGTDSTDRFDDDIWILPRKGSPLTTAIFNHKKKRSDNIKIYPNPAQNSFTIFDEDAFETTTLQIRNNLGQLVATYKMNSNTLKINTQNWNKGIYFIQLTDDIGNIITKKVIVQ